MTNVYISFAKSRFRNGSVSFASPSRFLNDIDRTYLRLSSSAPSAPRPSSVNPRKDEQERVRIDGRTLNSLQSISRSADKNADAKPIVKTVTSEWKPGDRVEHRVFGQGTVKSIYVDNDNEKIDINFDKVGKKTLLLTYAKLSRVES
jgi:DNA helicase-2/ATP-dependent DNA helicase PcrA